MSDNSSGMLEVFMIFTNGNDEIQKSQEAIAKQEEVIADQLEGTYDSQNAATEPYLNAIKNINPGDKNASAEITQYSTAMNAVDTLYRTLESTYNSTVQGAQSTLSTLGNTASEYIQAAKTAFGILLTIKQELSQSL